MLDADAQQTRGVHFEGLASQVEGLDPDVFGSADLVIDAGHRQAALFAHGLAFFEHDTGVDEGQQAVFLFADIHHDEPHMLVHLGGGQADARGGIHGFGHIGRQLADGVVHRGHGLGHGVQARIGEMKDFQQGHVECLRAIPCKI